MVVSRFGCDVLEDYQETTGIDHRIQLCVVLFLSMSSSGFDYREVHSEPYQIKTRVGSTESTMSQK